MSKITLRRLRFNLMSVFKRARKQLHLKLSKVAAVLYKCAVSVSLVEVRLMGETIWMTASSGLDNGLDLRFVTPEKSHKINKELQ